MPQFKTRPEIPDCQCRRCQTVRLICKRLQSVTDDGLRQRLEQLSQAIAAVPSGDAEKLALLLGGGRCRGIRDAYVEAMSNIVILSVYHETIAEALADRGDSSTAAVRWAADAKLLDGLGEILAKVLV